MSAALPLGVQAQMHVSSANDPAEKEADATASAVMRMDAPVERAAPSASRVHRWALPTLLPRKSAGPAQAGADVEAEIRGSLGGGLPLPPGVRQFMEPRFRADFSGVRIHTDAKAAGLASRLAARAFAFSKHVFFGRGEFRPDSPAGVELIAHELTHTIQQRAVVQRQEAASVTQTAPVQIQRLGIDTVLNYIADKANIIPGFRLFTIVIGVNPINMASVDASPANILRAAIEFIPGGGLVTQALDNSGAFEKVANWAAQQIKTLAALGGSVIQALKDFLKSLGVTDFARPGATWDRAKSIFTGPVEQIKSTVKGFVTGIVQFVKDAILKPIAKLAEGTPSYDMLKGVMGKDPITDEPVADSADLLIGGFMKLIGQPEVWDNMKKSGAVPKAWAWFKGAMSDLKAFVLQIPPTFVAAFKSLELADIILVPRAFAKLAGVFGTFLGRFISWAGEAMWNLLEIVVKAVNPGAWEYIQKTGAALKSILQNPLPFLSNLVAAGKGGFSAFGSKFLTHLKKGLIDWLTGSLDGVYIPKALSLGEIVKFAFSVLGLTYARFRVKMVAAFGEPTVIAIEKGFALLKTLVTEGPAAAWEQLKGELEALKEQVVEGIKGLVIEAVITKGIPKLVAMFIPGAGFIGAIVSIYDTVMVIVKQVAKIIAVVKSFVDSIVAIANGNIGAAVAKVESVLAMGLSLAINFFAAFAGLGKISAKINGVIEKIRAPVNKAMDSLIGWVKKMAKSFIDKVAGKDAPPEEKQKRVEKAAKAGAAACNKFAGKAVGDAVLKPLLFSIKVINRVSTLEPIKEGDTWSVRAAINPTFVTKTQAKTGEDTCTIKFVFEKEWPLEEFKGKVKAYEKAVKDKTVRDATKTRPPDSTGGRASTKPLRKGGQAKFRRAIQSFIANKVTKAGDKKSASDMMKGLEADHRLDLQSGGKDEGDNFSMIQKLMNGTMGSQLNAALNDKKIGPDTKITKVLSDDEAAGKKKNLGAESDALKLQVILVQYADPETSVTTIKGWFNLG